MEFLIGLLISTIVITSGIMLSRAGLNFWNLFLFGNFPTIIIVFCGSIGSLLVSYSPKEILKMKRIFFRIIGDKTILNEDIIILKELPEMLWALGMYSIGWGIIAFILGLVQMMTYMTDHSNFSAGFSVNLLSLFYGLVLAYTLWFPLSRKTKFKIRKYNPDGKT